MNRRQFLFGATTIVGAGSVVYPHRDELSKVVPEPNLDSKSKSTENETDSDYQEVEMSDAVELMRWRWNSWNPDTAPPNDYQGWAMAKLKNTSESIYDFKVKFTPIHTNGNELKTHGIDYKIKPLEYKKFTDTWFDNSTEYVDTLRIEILVSDQAWFNGWETIYRNEYEF